METGTVLFDSVTGLKLLVVEAPCSSENGFSTDLDITVSGRQLKPESIKPAGSQLRNLELTTDPGDRA